MLQVLCFNCEFTLPGGAPESATIWGGHVLGVGRRLATREPLNTVLNFVHASLLDVQACLHAHSERSKGMNWAEW